VARLIAPTKAARGVAPLDAPKIRLAVLGPLTISSSFHGHGPSVFSARAWKATLISGGVGIAASGGRLRPSPSSPGSAHPFRRRHGTVLDRPGLAHLTIVPPARRVRAARSALGGPPPPARPRQMTRINTALTTRPGGGKKASLFRRKRPVAAIGGAGRFAQQSVRSPDDVGYLAAKASSRFVAGVPDPSPAPSSQSNPGHRAGEWDEALHFT